MSPKTIEQAADENAKVVWVDDQPIMIRTAFLAGAKAQREIGCEDTKRLNWMIKQMELFAITIDETVHGKYRMVVGGSSGERSGTPREAIDSAMEDKP